MKTELLSLLDEIYEFGTAHDTHHEGREFRMRNVTPKTGELLQFLVRLMSVRDILEIGTSNGYSTLWLADAVHDYGGNVTTLEIDPFKANLAQINFNKSKLDPIIDLVLGDAGDYLKKQEDQKFDLIFMDSDRVEYIDWWPHINRVLKNDGLIVVDNVISHAEELKSFHGLVKFTTNVHSVLLPVEQGLLLIKKYM